MRLEHIRATFVPYRVDDIELKETWERLEALKTTSAEKMQNVDLRLAAIETKSGVLLTHITMMIAVTGLMLAVAQKPAWYDFLLASELVVYLILALGCIRCQYQFDGVDHQHLRGDFKNRTYHKYQRVLLGELVYREWLFRKTHRTLYGLTFLLIGTVMLGLFADDIGLFTGANQ